LRALVGPGMGHEQKSSIRKGLGWAPTCVAATKGSPLRGVTRLCTMLISSSASALASSV